MPAVGTPEPGGLSWRELTTLLRRTFERRRVVACDVVELCPIPGLASPNFIAAKLVYKLLTYKFAPAEDGDVASAARLGFEPRADPLLHLRQLLARVAGVHRLRELVDDALERRARFLRLARLDVGPRELHQDAVDRQRAVAVAPTCP